MTPFEPIAIQTERLILRFLTEADLPSLFDMFSNPEVMHYWSQPLWTDKSQARALLVDAQEGYRTRNALQLGIERRAGGILVGLCNLYHFHVTIRRAEMGYLLGRSYWGSGYMHEALQALLQYAFQTLDLNRLEAYTVPGNRASARTLERLGFQKEGHLRESWIVNGEITDTWIYGLLRREWQEHFNAAE